MGWLIRDFVITVDMDGEKHLGKLLRMKSGERRARTNNTRQATILREQRVAKKFRSDIRWGV